MSIYEYNEEYVRKSLLEEGQEIGYAEGKACETLGITVEEYEQAKTFLAQKRAEMN